VEKRNPVPIIKVTFAVIMWGASFIATKVALRDVSPVTVIWTRFLLGFLVIGAVVALRRDFVLPPKRDAAYFALLGFIGITFHQWLQATGLQTASASTTSWIVATTPIFMALLGWIFLREALGWVHILGIGLATLGVLLVITKGDFSMLGFERSGMPGTLYILLSAPNWAVFSLLSRRGLERYPAARMMLYVMGFGWLFSSVMLFSGPGLTEIASLTIDGWMGILFLGVFCSGVAYIFWYDGLQSASMSQVGALIYLEPLVTVIVAALMIDERILPVAMLGGLAILIGVYLVDHAAKHALPQGEHI
jgi:drug/metabolite transporter (DMT)-like permease